MDLHLESDDVAILRDIIDSTLRDMSYELSDSDNASFKEQLRQRRDRLQTIADRLH